MFVIGNQFLHIYVEAVICVTYTHYMYLDLYTMDPSQKFMEGLYDN